MNRSTRKPNIIEDNLPYFIGYKPTPQTSNLYLESFGSIEKAMKRHDHLKETEALGEIITLLFFASTREEAREKARKLLPAP